VKTLVKRILLLSTVVAGGFAVGQSATVFRPTKRPVVADSVAPATTKVPTEQLFLVYVAQSTCPWCKRKETASAIRSAVESLRQRADSVGIAFHSVGVAVEGAAQAGVTYLAGVADFDEVLSGGRWVNVGALRYVWDTHQGIGAVPQVIVGVRSLVTPESTGSTLFGVTSEDILVRKIGMFEIQRWLAAGMPMPAIPERYTHSAPKPKTGG
jgi:hypothetical protein